MNTATETKRPTDWRGWKITDEQCAAICNGDVDARNRFYIDNLEIIQRMAYCAIQRDKHPAVTADDLVQGVYVDMDYFCNGVNCPVTDYVSLIGFIHWSFHLAPYGGLAYCREHNPKITCRRGNYYDRTYTDNNLLRLDATVDGSNKHLQNDSESTYGEYIPDPRAELAFENTTDYTNDCKIIVADFLSPREREYFDLFMDGYGNSVISERMGYKGECNNGARVRDKLRKNYVPILDVLAYMGVDVDEYKGKTPYNPKTECTYKLTSEQRARAAESMRRQRAAKKAAMLAVAQQTTTQAAATL